MLIIRRSKLYYTAFGIVTLDFVAPFVMHDVLPISHVMYFTHQERVLLTGIGVRTGLE